MDQSARIAELERQLAACQAKNVWLRRILVMVPEEIWANMSMDDVLRQDPSPPVPQAVHYSGWNRFVYETSSFIPRVTISELLWRFRWWLFTIVLIVLFLKFPVLLIALADTNAMILKGIAWLLQWVPIIGPVAKWILWGHEWVVLTIRDIATGNWVEWAWVKWALNELFKGPMAKSVQNQLRSWIAPGYYFELLARAVFDFVLIALECVIGSWIWFFTRTVFTIIVAAGTVVERFVSLVLWGWGMRHTLAQKLGFR